MTTNAADNVTDLGSWKEKIEAAKRARGVADWENEIEYKQTNSGIKFPPTLSNLRIVIANHAAWQGLYRLNLLSGKIELQRRPPWSEPGHLASYPRQVLEEDYAETVAWFGARTTGGALACDTTIAQIMMAVALVSKDHAYHPIEDYLRTCTKQWDGVERLDTWLTSYVGAEDTAYTRAVGARWLISAIARIAEPGCQVDTMLVLEGAQGARKSSVLRALGGEWFMGSGIDMSSKEGALNLRGKWIIEIAELAGLNRTDVETVKAFLTTPSDDYRPPYGRVTVKVPRTSVFAGTVNHSEYLRDETGGRRFWPVAVGTIELESLVRDRDQIWGEAVVRYAIGDRWWLDTAELEAAAGVETADRLVGDEWSEAFVAWLQDDQVRAGLILAKYGGAIPTGQILQWAIGKTTDKLSPADGRRIAQVMRNLKWHPHRIGTAKIRGWGPKEQPQDR